MFEERLTEANMLYWSSVPLLQLMGRTAKNLDQQSSLVQELNLTGGDTFRYNWILSQYEVEVARHARWTRLNTLVSITSALENYMALITTAARRSDPMLRSGWPKLLDGGRLVKLKLPISVDPEPFTKGTWHSRVSTYERTFGTAPAILTDNIGDLDRLRVRRNAIAHRLGRPDPEDSAPQRYSRSQMQNVTVDYLKKSFLLISNVAKAVDEHLTRDFVGCFELVDLYSSWASDPKSTAKAMNVSVAGHNLQPNFFISLVAGRWPSTRAGVTPGWVTGLERYYRNL